MFCILLIVFILYILAIMPKILNRPSLDVFNNRYYAHRGLHGEKSIAPENSTTAFRLAVEHGFGIELDVQLSKDHIPVIFHDSSLKRVCGVDQKVNELTFQELRELTLFGSNERIPHLQEVLDLVDGQIPLIIEIKSDSKDISVCSVITPMLDDYTGVFCIDSFNPLILLWYKKNRPDIIRGQLSTNYFKGTIVGSKLFSFLLQYLIFNFVTKPHFISYSYEYGNNLSLILCRKLYGTKAIAYTISSKFDLDMAHKYFDLFIFEDFIPD